MRHVFTLVFWALGILAPSLMHGQNTYQSLITVPDSSCSATRVSAAPSGDIFVAGNFLDNNAVTTASLLTKLSSDGSLQWSKKWEAPDQIVDIRDIAATASGGVIVTIAYYLNNGFRNEIVALDATGETKWTKLLDNNANWGISDINVLQNGYLLSGYFSGTNSRSALIKIDENGNTLWSRQFNNVEIAPRALFEDTNGDLFLPGRSGVKGTLVRLSANGDLLKATDITVDGSEALGVLFSCVKTANDSLVLSGYDLDFHALLVKVDKNGNPGTSVYLATPNSIVFGVGSTSDASGNVYLNLLEDATSTRAMVAKLNSKLELVWANRFGNDSAIRTFSYDLTNSPSDGALLLCGNQFFGTASSVSFLVKTNTDGEVKGACCPTSVPLTRGTYKTVAAPSPVALASGLTLSNLTKSVTELVVDVNDWCPSEEKIIPDSSILVCPGNCIIFSMSNPRAGAAYQWEFAGASPDSSSLVNPGSICYNSKGDYTVLLKENGCILDTTMVKVDNPQDGFPNAFMPKPGAKNTTFRPIIQCPVEDYHLEIFNRWGDMIFEAFDPNEAWDGTVNGRPAPMDVYVYRVQYFATRDGERKLVYEAKKELTLIR